jgi:RNA polymerase sigma-70 factor, ECF subfamily
LDEQDWLVERFEEQRPRLRAVAYRMLGSLGDAEDAVQDAWLRLSRSGGRDVENLGAWLTTVVARVCLNVLEARGRRREEPLDERLPDPIVTLADRLDPEQQVLLADSVGLALLVVLETLSPAERLAFVLHDTFGLPFREIALIVGCTPVAARQLASRARRRVRGAVPPGADVETDRAVVDAFLAAAREGDIERLLSLLDPDVVLHADTGLARRGAVQVFRGSAAVAELVVAYGRRADGLVQPALVNGAPGVVALDGDGLPRTALAIAVVAGRVVEIDIVPDRRPGPGSVEP